MELVITHRAYAMIRRAIEKEKGLEVGGLARLERVDDETFKLIDIYIPPQEVSGGSFNVKGGEMFDKLQEFLGKEMQEMAKAGEEPLAWRRWGCIWHSHCNMGVSPSGTDLTQLNDIVKDEGVALMVGLVVNLKGEHHAWAAGRADGILFDVSMASSIEGASLPKNDEDRIDSMMEQVKPAWKGNSYQKGQGGGHIQSRTPLWKKNEEDEIIKRLMGHGGGWGDVPYPWEDDDDEGEGEGEADDPSDLFWAAGKHPSDHGSIFSSRVIADALCGFEMQDSKGEVIPCYRVEDHVGDHGGKTRAGEAVYCVKESKGSERQCPEKSAITEDKCIKKTPHKGRHVGVMPSGGTIMWPYTKRHAKSLAGQSKRALKEGDQLTARKLRVQEDKQEVK